MNVFSYVTINFVLESSKDFSNLKKFNGGEFPDLEISAAAVHYLWMRFFGDC